MFKNEIPVKEWGNIRKISLFLKCRKYSMNNWPSLSTLYDLAKRVRKDKIDGDFVECGCCNGGAGAMTTQFLLGRKFWLFDSFEGLPPSEKEDVKNDDNVPAKKIWFKGWDKGSIENVEELYFDKLEVPRQNVVIIKGLFQDTVPIFKNEIKSIALLHLDGDWYESTKICIEQLFDKVVNGGYIIIDDYGHWKGCKKAVDEFLNGRYISTWKAPSISD